MIYDGPNTLFDSSSQLVFFCTHSAERMTSSRIRWLSRAIVARRTRYLSLEMWILSNHIEKCVWCVFDCCHRPIVTNPISTIHVGQVNELKWLRPSLCDSNVSAQQRRDSYKPRIMADGWQVWVCETLKNAPIFPKKSHGNQFIPHWELARIYVLNGENFYRCTDETLSRQRYFFRLCFSSYLVRSTCDRLLLGCVL